MHSLRFAKVVQNYGKEGSAKHIAEECKRITVAMWEGSATTAVK
jgi:hypothetical protein